MPWYDTTESSPIAKGDVVCLVPSDDGVVRVATATAARLGVGTPLGVALAASVDGQPVPVAESGVVAAALLAGGPKAEAGGRAWASVDEHGRLVRADVVTASTVVIGFVDDQGNLSVAITPARQTAGVVDLSGGLARALGQRADAIEARLSSLEAELARLQARQLELLGLLAAAPSSTTIAALEARLRRLESGDGGGAAAEPTPATPDTATPSPEPQAWSAIQLSGAGASRARAPLAASLRLRGTMTLELWVRPDELVDDRVIVGTDPDGEGVLTLSTGTAQSTRILGATSPCALIYEFGGAGAGRQRLSAALELTVGAWVHLAVVRQTAADDTHLIRIYRDGVRVLEQRTPAVSVDSPGYRWALGGNGAAPLAGAFADLRIWSTARTEAEIADNMRVRQSGQRPGLVGYWRLDERDAPALLAHATDPALSLEASEVRAVADGPGVAVLVEAVPALRFDGDTRLVLGRPEAHPWRQSFTLEMWVRPSSVMQRGGFFVFQYGTDMPIASIGEDGTLHSLGRSTPGALPADRWSHVALVVDRSGEARTAPSMYVNGVAVASAVAPVPATSGVAPTVIGFQPWSQWGPSFIGDIAEIRVWSRVLGAAEIRDVLQRRPAASEAGLAGWWTFPADSGQVVPDLSPHGNHAVLLRQAPSPASGPALVTATGLSAPRLLNGAGPSRALRFDGQATTQLRVADHVTNRVTGDLTVEAWLRVSGNFRYGELYAKSEASEGEGTIYLLMDPTERSIRYYGQGNTAGGPNSDYCAAELVPGVWFHLAFVRDSLRRELRYYINGALARIDLNCKPVSGTTSAGPLTIGTRVLGDLAELRVWSVARDEAGIRRDLGRRLTSASGLLARWALDEGSGTVAKNSTAAGAAIDATLVGGASWITDGPALS